MNNKRWDALWVNAEIATLEPNAGPYGLISNGAIAIKDGKIAWVGSMRDLPHSPDPETKVYNAENRCITPGLIDCHTHLVYAGNRCHEFELRLKGATYEEIAQAGGGIRATVTATRTASEEELFQQSLRRARALVAEGVTTLEIKSGYGLDLVNELKILHVAKRIGEVLPVTVVKTFLGAHALPTEYHGRADEYVDFLCEHMLPHIAELKLADAVDVFCEKIGFNLRQTEYIFKTAKELGLAVKCHAEQLSDSGAAILAARYHALSADHLEFLTEKGVKALAEAGTVAVLLPGAFYFLRETHFPPIELLRQYNVPIAIASDSNPGTSPVSSLLLMMNMANTFFKLTPEEILTGVTRNAAKALGLENSRGTLTAGKNADFVIWDIAHPSELAYQIGANPCYLATQYPEKSIS